MTGTADRVDRAMNEDRADDAMHPAIDFAGMGRSGALHAAGWIAWLVGMAMLATVVIAALHFSEQRQLLRIVRTAQPWWLVVAFALQAATSAAQGETWRLVGHE